MVASPPPTSHRLTVLLANEREACPSPCNLTVQHLLASQGVNLLTAHTGREALSLLESRTVHLAVLDHRMPQLGGLQIIKLVREHKKTPPATILLADTLNPTLLHDALAQDIFTVLAKPINHDQLLDAMARAIKRFHQNLWPTPTSHQ